MARPEQDVDAALEAARTAWPRVRVRRDRLAAYLAERGVGATAYLADLALACACVDRDEMALCAFDDELSRICHRVARRAGGDSALAGEVAQRLRERILVGKGGEPSLLEYSGRGPLAGWLRVAATREVLMLRRREKFEAPLGDSAIEALHSADSDPELAYLHRKYRPAFREAFADAFAALSPLDRDLVRRHHVGGESIDALGVRLNVHRSTAARWIARARERLLAATRSGMADRLAIDEAELDSILQLVRSQLDVSLRSHV